MDNKVEELDTENTVVIKDDQTIADEMFGELYYVDDEHKIEEIKEPVIDNQNHSMVSMQQHEIEDVKTEVYEPIENVESTNIDSFGEETIEESFIDEVHLIEEPVDHESIIEVQQHIETVSEANEEIPSISVDPVNEAEKTLGGEVAIVEHDAMTYLPAITEDDEISAGGWKKRVVVITGGSGGIGSATAHLFSIYADVVYNLDLRMQEEDNINFIKTDVRNYDEVKASITKVFEKEGQIDVLINMAGIGISGTSEGITPENMQTVMATNFLGVANACACVIPYMRGQQRGRIINIASLSSQFALPFQAFYSASKAAVTNYTNALRSEVSPFNIKVTSVSFSEVNSGFSDNRLKNRHDDKAYKYNLAKSVAKFEFSEQYGSNPQDIAKKLFKLSNKKNPKPVIVFGLRDKMWCFLARFITQRAINRLVSKRY
ncbi:MAG: SDR family NAD(P)-dependent oxidoreductase [Firmicutes bacterium]|nr:SDR family NAD(P)-dependent oxidoreductase [Bacillota bacterium]